MRRFLRAPLLLLTLFAMPLLGGCGRGEASGGAAAPPARPQPPPVPVLVAEVTRQALAVEVSTVGTLRSPETTMVASDIAGIIVELNAPEGREIAKGHLVARLDDSQTRAMMQVAEARTKNAQIALDRAKPLVRDGVAPQQTLDNAVAEMATAEGLLEEARTRFEKTRIKAPFGGRVGIQTAQLGQFVSSGDPIIELTRLDPLELVFGVPQEQAATARVGQRVQARIGRCGAAFEAVVEAIDPQVDPRTRTLAVQSRVDNRDRALIPGMSARVRLVVGELTDRLAVPREALVSQGTRYLVWVVDGEGKVQPRPVVPGRYLPDVVEVREGLEVGEQVVVAGHQKLRPGAGVAPSPWQRTANPNLERGERFGDDCGDDAP